MREKMDATVPGVRGRPILATILAALTALAGVGGLVGSVYVYAMAETGPAGELWIVAAGLVVGSLSLVLANGLWRLRNWARTALMLALGAYVLYTLVVVLFDVFAQVFAGVEMLGLGDILRVLLQGLVRALRLGVIPVALMAALNRLGRRTDETQGERAFVDRAVRYLLLAMATSAVLVVGLIVAFTMAEAWTAVEEIGVGAMLTGTIWRPGQEQYGLVPMFAGSILSTAGAVLLGVPLSILTAILLAEVASPAVRNVVRPAVELLAGIPSVVYGLFGMVVLAPLIREVPVARNTGYGILNASVILAVMILPTVTNIAEDAIRAVPRSYKEGSLALGATHWQTIVGVMLPAARSGIVAAVILGVGRALGETMALIMVIGNSIAMPAALNDNPLTIFLSMARTLTGNVAVEINYAAGAHKSALFFTGVMLFVLILLTNSLARYLMRARRSA